MDYVSLPNYSETFENMGLIKQVPSLVAQLKLATEELKKLEELRKTHQYTN